MSHLCQNFNWLAIILLVIQKKVPARAFLCRVLKLTNCSTDLKLEKLNQIVFIGSLLLDSNHRMSLLDFPVQSMHVMPKSADLHFYEIF
ncbi:hypothetical protein SAMN03080594_102228 [Arenibacter palladensis]|uniref:Uncharacterized protein n=1 Tax=Arenibacter palladensis TaxID=237373 RepID=A0A1M4XWU7_9FLAO|nr:hypothetical protein SAMN03080594_102228 [Arenibacter palladensis]